MIISDAASPMTTPTPPAASSSAPSAADLTASDALGNESTFLQLLVAQIQNQDPTAPMDSTTFLNQLAEFSQLEQLIGIRQDVSALDPSGTGTTSSATAGTPSTDPTSGS